MSIALLRKEFIFVILKIHSNRPYKDVYTNIYKMSLTYTGSQTAPSNLQQLFPAVVQHNILPILEIPLI